MSEAAERGLTEAADQVEATTEARVEATLAAVEHRLSETERTRLRESTRRLVQFGLKLGAFPLSNGDEPGPIFGAYRGED